MKSTLNTHEAISLLMADENAAWTMAGARALVEHLEQVEEDCGEETEFDRVALRCEFNQYESLNDWAEQHFSIADYIRERGQLIEFDGGIIVSEF